MSGSKHKKDEHEIIKTIKLISFIEDYDKDLEELEYILYIVQKRKNKEDVIQENIFNVSILVNIFKYQNFGKFS